MAVEQAATPIGWPYRFEGWLAELLFGGFKLLSIDRASALGGAIARTIGPRLGVSKRARINLRRALPALTDDEIAAIIRGMWDNLGRVVAEYPHLRGVHAFGPESRVEIVGVEHIDRSIAAGRQFILVAGHLGNWEVAPLSAGQYGLKVAFVYRAANNPLVEHMMSAMRAEWAEFTPKGPIASRRVVGALREKMHLGMLVDQKMNDGIAVPFFGRDAMTAPAVARLALRYDLDVIPVRSERLQGAHFRLTVNPPIPHPNTGDRDADMLELMAAVNQTLEDWIRDRPDQWFWLHRRWPS
jgi:Kdo2-lipid IVA lauroyltransferase/acyltransferase